MVPVLLKKIAELEARLGQNSSNSSRPPSSDPPCSAPAPPKPPTDRNRGGQPGHKKHERILLPPKRVSETTDLKPTECRRCGKVFFGSDNDPFCHQVMERMRYTHKACRGDGIACILSRVTSGCPRENSAIGPSSRRWGARWRRCCLASFPCFCGMATLPKP